MKVIYDASVDVMTVTFNDAAVEESDEDKPRVIIDYDAVGNLVSIEILDASKRVGLPTGVEYAVVGISNS